MEEFGSMADYDFGDSNEAVLTYQMRAFEHTYFAFPNLPPVSALKVLKDETSAGYYVPEQNLIVLSSLIARFAKVCHPIILHELIHHKLYCENRDPDKDEGVRFEAEIQRLWDAGAYRKML